MNVLSLFDGISCGQLALQRAGIKVDKYYASEIDKHAIQITQKNFPNTIQLGDINNWQEWNLPKIDLLIGGSPCQGFSSAGNELNFFDPRSKLFFDFVRAREKLQPKYFLLENVKMRKEYEDTITRYMGVAPIEINSALVSAQNRVRLYWTNIPGIKQPKDRGINLTDILEDDVFTRPAAIRTRPIPNENYRKSLCLEVNDRNKSLCLMTVQLNNLVSSLPPGRYLDYDKTKHPARNYSTVEMCRLQTLPDNYVTGVSLNQAAKLLGNAWTADVIAHIFSYLNLIK